jgi:single-stranded-DNA-specific exonuclease
MAKWMVAAKRADFDAIAGECGISPVLARLIRNRNVIGAGQTRRYLCGTVEDLRDPFLLPGMDDAVRILGDRIAQGKKIRIIGDYDVDGICSAYVLWRGLTALGADVDSVLPDRVTDGYGLNVRMIRQAAADGVDTIVTCDNGIAATDALREAAMLGMTAVVTDHHEIPYRTLEDGRTVCCLPQAAAIVEPKMKAADTGKNLYPFPDLCGAAVAWKLICGLHRGNAQDPQSGETEKQLLAFVALATVCDVMPLQDENRILTRCGLKMIRETDNMGLRALLETTGLSGRELTGYHAGFILGPCLNASGRLDSAERALRLFRDSSGMEDAMRTAQELRDLNESRKGLTSEGLDKAVAAVEESPAPRDRILVVMLQGCRESICGIIAGRLREKYSRPAFVFADSAEDGMIKGSGRSVEQYDMYEGMSRCADLFERFGGHRMAGGITMKAANLDAFRKRVNVDCRLSEEDLEEVLHLDMELPPRCLTEALTEEMSLLEPCGTGNEKPLFGCRDMKITQIRTPGTKGNIVKLTVEDGAGGRWQAVRFTDAASFLSALKEKAGTETVRRLTGGIRQENSALKADLCYYPEINTWNGVKSIQMVLRDIRWKDAG